ncbi:MAG TPA: ABC transporter substrate-binding protein [Hyphomicrobiaceae bacterium]|nr:ABC transporter substrate-binding protein [Hyphomicrobiaceae bacterium]
MDRKWRADRGHTTQDLIARRQLLRGGLSLATTLAASSLPLATGLRAEPLPRLEIWGPPAGPSITILHAIATGRLDKAARRPSLRVWRQVDEMRAGLTSKSFDVGIMPVPVAANLYNKGLGVRLVNVMTDGILYIMSSDPNLTSLDKLKGRKLAVLFPNELPALILNRLLKYQGINPKTDIEITATATPLEAMQFLVLGRVDAALVPEPAASATIVKGAIAGKTIHRVIDLQTEWAEMNDGETRLPQAGLAVTDTFRAKHAVVLRAIQNGLVEAVADVNANPARAASNSAGQLGLPWPVIETSIHFSRLVATPAHKVRKPIEGVIETLLEANPGYVGGRMPDDGFYL